MNETLKVELSIMNTKYQLKSNISKKQKNGDNKVTIKMCDFVPLNWTCIGLSYSILTFKNDGLLSPKIPFARVLKVWL